MRFSFERYFYVQAAVVATLVILYYGRMVFIPFSFSLLFAFILYPMVRWLEIKHINRIISILIAMTLVILLILGVGYFFSSQISYLSKDFGEFLIKLQELADRVLDRVNDQLQIVPGGDGEEVRKKFTGFVSSSGFSVVSDTIIMTTKFVSWLGIALVITFLLLFYRNRFVNGLSLFVNEEDRPKFLTMLKEIRFVGQNYLAGMAILIIVMGLFYSFGLLIVGVEYPFFFGYMAALLAIIPYVGTFSAGMIPTMYALVIYDNYWIAIGVIIVFVTGQILEGNLLNPFIVGANLHVNALAAIICLIIGGIIWGIPGMIVFLPLTAMVKVVCKYYDNLKPVSELISDVDERKLRYGNVFAKWGNFFKRKKISKKS
jgi:predicted PurR-regulated permease PerM